MSSAQHRDAYAASKEIAPEHLAAFKARINQMSDEALKEVRAAKRDLSFADDFRSFYAALDELAAASRKLSFAAHMVKFDSDWRLSPLPQFNDHSINQFYVLPALRRTFWLEGAVFCGLALDQGQRILELCCGMGWYTDYFYSPFASEIVAVDFDPRAIEMARRFHQRPNIKYELMDIRTAFPAGPFDAVIWDGAIEHFTEAEIDGIMGRMREAMVANAPLVGYTAAEPTAAPQLPSHETHFEGIEHLARLLKRHFANVRVFERLHPTQTPPRHNLFFYASDGPLPFDENWQRGLRL